MKPFLFVCSVDDCIATPILVRIADNWSMSKPPKIGKLELENSNKVAIISRNINLEKDLSKIQIRTIINPFKTYRRI